MLTTTTQAQQQDEDTDAATRAQIVQTLAGVLDTLGATSAAATAAAQTAAPAEA